MKTYQWIQIYCYGAFILLLLFSNKYSYDAGFNDGKITMCELQDEILVKDKFGERCIDKDTFRELKTTLGEEFINEQLLNISYEAKIQ